MLCHTNNHWGRRNCNQRIGKEHLQNTSKAFNRFSIKDSHTKHIAHKKGSATVWNLKAEGRGSGKQKRVIREETIIQMFPWYDSRVTP